MDHIVGDEKCSFLEICDILLASKSSERLIEKLVPLARALQLSVDVIHRLKLSEKLSLGSRSEALHEILTEWRSRQSDKARLSVIIANLVKVDLVDCADELRKHFKFQQILDAFYVCSPNGYDEFIASKSRILVISSMDKNVTATKLTDTTSCVHLQDDLEFARHLATGSADLCFSVACDKKFGLYRLEDIKGSGFTCRIIIITEDHLESAQALCSKYDNEVTFVRDSLKWSHLSLHSQLNVAKNSVFLSGKLMNFDDVVNKGDMRCMLNDILEEQFLLDLVNDKKPNLIESGIPARIKHYVPRRISPRNLLNSTIIFKEESNDIFLFTGIKRHELSRYTNPHPTDTSSNQKRKASPTVKYMLLDMKSDFESIADKAKVPQHLIDYKNGNFYWVKSSGSIETVQKAILRNHSQIIEYSEQDFVNKTQENEGCHFPVIISDAPGMGKSELLANCARKLESRGEIALFGVMYDLVKGLKTLQTSGMEIDDAVIQQLSILGGSRPVAQTFLRDLLKSGDDNVRVNIFLDGLDEVLTSDMELALKILKSIKSITTTRLWVATRTHLLNELENCLSSLGHTIQEFNSRDQMECLVEFWKGDRTCEKRLGKFANHCLQSLASTAKGEIAGVPLQCMLIGDIFKEEATNFANPDNLNTEFPPTIQIESITQLFQIMIEKKLEKFFARYKRVSNKAATNFYRKDLIQAHIFFSLKLLFPEINIFKENSRLQLKDVLNVGILKFLSSDGVPQFIHRLFAEFFVALFLTRIFHGEKRQEEIVEADKFFSAVFATRGYEEKINYTCITTYKFEQNLILYFVDQLIQSSSCNFCPNVNSKQFAQSCINANFPNLFECFDKMGFFTGQERSVFDSNLAILAARNSEIELISRICEKYEKASGFRVRDIILEYSYTILHIAVATREFSVVEHFVNDQGFRKMLEKNRKLVCNLVQECVAMSQYNSDELVREKLDTLNLLLHFNAEFFQDTSSNNQFLGLVHRKLICELARLGADVMVLGQQMSTLHWWCIDSPTAEHYHELVSHFPTSSISKLLQLKESQEGFTPLHYLVDWMDPDPRTLQLFKQLGADFNSFNLNQDSVLETAVKEHRSITTLDQLILHGADWRPKEANDWTILHVALGSLNIEAFKYFCEKMTDDPRLTRAVSNIVHWDDLEKYELISEIEINLNAKDKLGHTLLQGVLKYRTHFNEQHAKVKLISLLERNGAITSTRLAFKVLVYITKPKYDSKERDTLIRGILSNWPSVLEEKDSKGNTLLHHAVSIRNNAFFDSLISRKPDTNCRNNLGESPLHLVVEAKSAKTLVKHGADLTSLDNNNLTPIHRAIQRKDAAIVESLLKCKKANDVHLPNPDYLLYASEFGNFSTFQVCLVYQEREQDSNVAKFKPDNISMLYASVRNPDPQIFEHLIKNIDEKLLDQIVHKIVASIKPDELNEGIIDGKIKMLELVKTKSKCLINSGDSTGRISLILENIHVDLRIWLMENVAEPRISYIEGRNNIFYGVTQEQHPEQLKKFLEYLIKSDHGQQFRAQSSSLLLEISQRKNVKVTPDILQVFRDQEVDLNAVDKNGMSVLMHAVKSGWDADLLTKLVEMGSDWEMTNKQQSGILHLAAESRNIDALKLFVTKCDVNTRNINLDTPLHTAIKTFTEYHALNVEVANLLILEGADITAENKDGLSALDPSNYLGLLHHAVTIFDLHAIQFLIQKGFDVNARNNKGGMPIHYAVGGKHREEVFLMKNLLGRDTPFKSPHALLEIARRFENWVDCVDLLEKHGANLYAKDNAGQNILHMSVSLYLDEDFRKLLDYVVDKFEEQLIQKRDKRKRTLLHLAVMSTRIGTQTLDILLKYNNINDTDINGRNVLFYWIEGNDKSDLLGENMDTLKFLLEKGADVKAKDLLGISSLHYVVMTLKPQNFEQVIDLLIHYGADVFDKCDGAINMVHLAAKWKNPGAFQKLHSLCVERGFEKLLKVKESNGGSVLHNAACYLELNEELLSQLLRFNDINDVDNDGDSVLYYAIQGQRTTHTFEMLISKGAEWKESTNKRGDTVLHFAAWWGSVEALHFFMEKGCDINARNNLGETPLHCALRRERLRQRDRNMINESVHEVVEILMKANPDLNTVDEHGQTPILLAKEQLQLKKLVQRTVDLLSGK